MRKFIKELLLFGIPFYAIGVWCLLSMAILSRYSDMYFNTDTLLNTDEKTIVGLGLKQDNLTKYKWAYMQRLQRAEIWALGSSRVLHFRADMFKQSFYNAGYTIRRAGDYKVFMETFEPEKHPKLLIIGLDQWLFNAQSGQTHTGRDPAVWEKWDVWEIDLYLYKQLTGRIFRGQLKDNFEGRDDIRYYGSNALLNGRGLRNDGSMDYGIDIDLLLKRDETKLDKIHDDIVNSITNRGNRFEKGDSVDDKALSEIELFLSYCKQNGIKVIGFLPPYADFTLDLMHMDGGYTYIDKIFPILEPLFDQFGYEVYDFTTLGSFGSDDSEILDGYHIAEIGYQKILIEILNRKPESMLSDYVDVNQLKTDMDKRVNDLVIYDY